jgi:hypothetical protein
MLSQKLFQAWHFKNPILSKLNKCKKTLAIGFRDLVYIVREGNRQSVAGFHLG